MNLWSFVSLVVGVIYVAGFVALVYCAKHAPEGYEDADGFHVGRTSGQAKAELATREPSVAEALEQATWQTSAPF